MHGAMTMSTRRQRIRQAGLLWTVAWVFGGCANMPGEAEVSIAAPEQPAPSEQSAGLALQLNTAETLPAPPAGLTFASSPVLTSRDSAKTLDAWVKMSDN